MDALAAAAALLLCAVPAWAQERLQLLSAGWAGGTRIASSLNHFNRDWSRRVLGQGAIVILFTDGLERDGGEDLGRQMERLRKSCRRVIWVNPLLRYEGFEAKVVSDRHRRRHAGAWRPWSWSRRSGWVWSASAWRCRWCSPCAK